MFHRQAIPGYQASHPYSMCCAMYSFGLAGCHKDRPEISPWLSSGPYLCGTFCSFVYTSRMSHTNPADFTSFIHKLFHASSCEHWLTVTGRQTPCQTSSGYQTVHPCATVTVLLIHSCILAGCYAPILQISPGYSTVHWYHLFRSLMYISYIHIHSCCRYHLVITHSIYVVLFIHSFIHSFIHRH